MRDRIVYSVWRAKGTDLSVEHVVQRASAYWHVSGSSEHGPFRSIEAALEARPALSQISPDEDTEIVSCELNDVAIADLLDGPPGASCRINGWPWTMEEGGIYPLDCYDHPDFDERVVELHWRREGEENPMYALDGTACLDRVGHAYFWRDGQGNIVDSFLGVFRTRDEARQALWDVAYETLIAFTNGELSWEPFPDEVDDEGDDEEDDDEEDDDEEDDDEEDAGEVGEWALGLEGDDTGGGAGRFFLPTEWMLRLGEEHVPVSVPPGVEDRWIPLGLASSCVACSGTQFLVRPRRGMGGIPRLDGICTGCGATYGGNAVGATA